LHRDAPDPVSGKARSEVESIVQKKSEESDKEREREKRERERERRERKEGRRAHPFRNCPNKTHVYERARMEGGMAPVKLLLHRSSVRSEVIVPRDDGMVELNALLSRINTLHTWTRARTHN
jgi:hypothetical protein